MKICPHCGYKPTPADAVLSRMFRKSFKDIPVTEMLHRGWIDPYRWDDVDAVRTELMRFFEMDRETFQSYIDGTHYPEWLNGVMVCSDIGTGSDDFNRGRL